MRKKHISHLRFLLKTVAGKLRGGISLGRRIWNQ